MDDCIFCKIARGEIPCAKIWEDNKHLAFLDANPNTKGMTLVITKEHFDSYAFDMPDKDYLGVLHASKTVSKILEKGLGVKRVAMVMEGLGVNHVHMKLYPMHGLDEKFKETYAPQKHFFENYEGYISTILGPHADNSELQKIAEEIKQKAGLN